MRNGVISRLAAHLLHYGVNINVNIPRVIENAMFGRLDFFVQALFKSE